MTQSAVQLGIKSEKVLRSAFVALANLCYDRDAEKVLIVSDGLDQLLPIARKHKSNASTMRAFIALCRNVSNNGALFFHLSNFLLPFLHF